MSFLLLPPEINSLRMFLGAGSAPMLQAAGACFNNSASGAVGNGASPLSSFSYNGSISGFGNTAHGATVNDVVAFSTAGGMSGFFNTASGAPGGVVALVPASTSLAYNALISGFFNNGVTAAVEGLPAGIVSGIGSGWFKIALMKFFIAIFSWSYHAIPMAAALATDAVLAAAGRSNDAPTASALV